LKRPTVLELLEKFEYFLQNMKSDVKIENNEEINDFVIPEQRKQSWKEIKKSEI
jgi:hypothetical protein